MAINYVKKGLGLPIAGRPEQVIDDAAPCTRVAVMADDYPGMRPRMRVAVGDQVQRGQVLFEDKKTPGVLMTAPGSGTVIGVNRGARRALQSVVIDLDERERTGQSGAAVTFEAYSGQDPISLGATEIKALLLESGLWTALRGRPYGRVANPEVEPHSIFVTAMDTNPLAALPDVVMAGAEADFETGLFCIRKLTTGALHLCRASGSAITGDAKHGVQISEFEGVHPAGTAGYHIHRLDPVSRDKTVWQLDYQDVIAIGRLFKTGTLDMTRVISLAGPAAQCPRLLRTRLGASTDELVKGELHDGDIRVVSGSVLSGRTAAGEIHGYLGRYHSQVSVLKEGRKRRFFGWVAPSFGRFSNMNVVFSRLLPGKLFAMDTDTNGGTRAMVPLGQYEKVMAMDIPATFLLRALVAGDLEKSEEMGCLELIEEDLALCTFACPSKINYGPVLRERLTEIEKEG